MSSVNSRDDYVIKQIPRVRMIEIDCGHIPETKFNLSRKKKSFCWRKDAFSAEDALARLGNDLSNTQGRTA